MRKMGWLYTENGFGTDWDWWLCDNDSKVNSWYTQTTDSILNLKLKCILLTASYWPFIARPNFYLVMTTTSWIDNDVIAERLGNGINCFAFIVFFFLVLKTTMQWLVEVAILENSWRVKISHSSGNIFVATISFPLRRQKGCKFCLQQSGKADTVKI